VAELDVGVFRVGLLDRPDWVARVFPAARPMTAVAGDAAILTFLADHEFPAERCAASEPVTDLHGRGVLVTEYVDAVPREARRAAIRDEGGLRRLGEWLGRLHTLPDDSGGITRPGGAWHHLADGGPKEEIAAASRLLTAAENRVAADQRPLYESMRAALDGLDACEDLPLVLTHPDFVLANVVASPDRGLVVVDWAGAGRGARLWSLAWLLFAEGVKDVRRVDRVAAGYRTCVELEPEELSRLAAVLPARWVTLRTWEFGMGRKALVDAAREIADGIELASAITARARAAFASTVPE
jgi:Ser/Thr protein kinase RdoA (MazF antagonist)